LPYETEVLSSLAHLLDHRALSRPLDARSAEAPVLCRRNRAAKDVYEFHVDDSVISVIVDDGEMQVIEGQSGRPVDVEIHVDATTFIEWEWGAFADAMRCAKGSCDSWAANRLFAATRASFARWLCRDRVAHVSIVHGGSVTVVADTDAPAVSLPFGRHRGIPLADVPMGYLEWTLTERIPRSEALRRAVQAELARRAAEEEGRPSGGARRIP
jgi:Putative quorum-sensing-regulated virulence factor